MSTTALAGLQAAQKHISAASNNIANASSIGFKKSSANFADIVKSSSPETAGISPSGLGTRSLNVREDFTQGPIKATGRSLDVAVVGEGFLIKSTTAGDADKLKLTRDGRFSLDDQGCLVDGQGCFVLGADLQKLTIEGSLTRETTKLTYDVDPNDLDLLLGGFNPKTSLVDQTVKIGLSKLNDGQFAVQKTEVPDLANDAVSIVGTTVYKGDGVTALPVARLDENYGPTTGASLTLSFLDPTIQATDDGVSPDSSARVSEQAIGFEIEDMFSFLGLVSVEANMDNDRATLPLEGMMTITVNNETGTPAVSEIYPLRELNREDGPARTVELSNIEISQQGLINVSYANGLFVKQVGPLGIAYLPNPEELQKLGMGDYALSEKTQNVQILAAGVGGNTAIQQGALEQSNIDLTAELTGLISSQMMFQATAKTYQATGEIINKIADIR